MEKDKYEIRDIKNKVIKGDSLLILKNIPSESIDMIFADPPYFMQTEGKLERFNGSEFKGVNDEWDKFDSYKDYDTFTKKWLLECKRILKRDGTIWTIGTYHNLFRLGYIMQDLNFWIINDIVWQKSNPTPNFKGTKFVNSQETLIWGSKSKKSKYTFNYKTMKYLNENKQMKSIWKFPISSGNERIKDNNGKKLHNTQKPIKLLEYVILSSTKKGDIILDPFFGTGTTGAVAKSLNRDFIGIEKNEEYINASISRIDKVKKNTNFTKEIIENNLDRKERLVHIKKLIEDKYIIEKFLYNKKNKIKVKLNEDGTTTFNDKKLSIHKMAGFVQDIDNYNGWSFWYVKREGNLVSIDEIRKKYRLENFEK